jgi:hypothetical protein
MGSQVKKSRRTLTDSGLGFALPSKAQKQSNCVTIEVVSLREMPLLERHKEANKPLFLNRYE